MYDPVVKEPNYVNIFECGKNHLGKLDTTCKRACMETPIYKYCTEFFSTVIE